MNCVQKFFWLAGTILVLLAMGCLHRRPPPPPVDPQYAESVRNGLIATYGEQINGYTVYGVPIGNRGVGTIYRCKSKCDSQALPKDLSTFDLVALGNHWIDQGAVPDQKEREQWMTYIFPAAVMPSTNGSSKVTISRNLGIDLSSLVEAGGKLDFSKGVATSLTVEAVVKRELVQLGWARAITKKVIAPDLLGYLKAGNILIVTKELELTGYQIKIDVDRSRNAELGAKLDELIAKNPTALKISGLKASLQFKRDANGAFVADSRLPVVAAVMLKAVPAGAAKGGGDTELKSINFDSFPTAVPVGGVVEN
jgi:hypothetical protein